MIAWWNNKKFRTVQCDNDSGCACNIISHVESLLELVVCLLRVTELHMV